MAVILRGLMTLGWVSVALAALSTPLIAEPILSRDLEIRQVEKCPGAYTSTNGLNFTTYCEQNNPFNDAQPAFESPSMQDCMEHCSRYWGAGEGCFGVVWVENRNECWIRNSTVTTASLYASPTDHSALIKEGEMSPLPSSCPAEDGSTHTLDGVDGLEYTVNCGKVIDGFDTCFSDYEGCWNDPYKGFFHAETLEECLRTCIDQHPLCKAVSFNPGLEIGFANCWPKTDFTSTKLISPRANMGILHTATITSIERIDTNCPEQAYTAHNKIFDIHCGQLNTGTNITHIHTQNITSCMDACATTTEPCIGILFDSTLQFGFKNCALQKTTNYITSQAHATFAVVTTATPTSSPSSSSSPGSSQTSATSSTSSTSKAWIAGPVVGGIAAIALIALAIFWWRRRKAAVPYAEKDGTSVAPGTAYNVAPAYSPAASPQQQHQQQQYYDPPMTEMGDESAHNELPASTKYAQKTTTTSHELPS